ncbi:MAG: hypothetical protein HYU41_14785 [Candidatus Rokubacteria bacterium]|nr:hypothetical protein [Candidatus Rokubacteria bacterium]
MKTIIALALFGLVLAGTAAADPAPAPPWATLADLEQSVTQVFEVSGCADTRPIALLVVADGADTYFLIVNTDARWAIMGPADTGEEPRIWYGTVLDEGRLLVERVLVGTLATDVCPFLTRSGA